MSNARLEDRLRRIRLLAMDVDGVLTEGRISWGADADGRLFEIKTFNVRDGLGLGLARAAGLQIAWITGRTSPVVEQRAAELGVQELCQWARDKRTALEGVSMRLGFAREEVLYVGDDLNDLPAFEVAGVRVAVADAAALVREQADWVTETPGGRGAVREVVERVLRAQDCFGTAVSGFMKATTDQHGPTRTRPEPDPEPDPEP